MKKFILVTIGLSLALALGSIAGCASGGSGGSGSVYSAPPAGSKLAEVSLESSDAAVRQVMGEPDDSNAYMTGKGWIPFYYGPDTHRTDWIYRGQGRVVFSRNRWTGGVKVIKVMYNPNELQ